MEWSDIAKNWAYRKEEIRRRWDFLSGTDLDDIAGDRDRLVGKLEERYGLSRRNVEAWVDDFLRHADVRKAA